LRSIGSELRLARNRHGLSLRLVASQVAISPSQLSRVERGLAEHAELMMLARLAAVVGLDLVARAYPGTSPIRDSRHGQLLGRLRTRIHPGLGWATEVALPGHGDQRSWDAMVRGTNWRYGIEAEMNPIDGQALLRRIHLKQRDGDVTGVILLLPETRTTRQFRSEFAVLLATEFSIHPRRALACLAVGRDPGGNTLIVL